MSKQPHVSVHLRSTKLAQPKISVAHRIGELLAEYSLGTTKLVMPTRPNLEIFEKVLVTAGALVDMKRQVERVEQEIRTLKAQKEGGWVVPTQEMVARKVS
jgi:DNA methyltransferase 1-associated protein 1